MPVTPAPPSPPAGFLWRAGWYLDTSGRNLRNLGDKIGNVWLIGQHLGYPFRAIGEIIIGAGHRLYEADDDLLNVKRWVISIIDGWGFVNLLYWASDNFRVIREDPRNWVLGMLYHIGSHLWLLAVNPIEFLKQYFRHLSYWLGLLVDNPWSMIDVLLRQLRGWLGLFLDNPLEWLRGWIRHLGWQVGLFLDNPWALVNTLLRGLPGDLGLLIDNPRYWVYARLREIAPDLIQFIQNPDWFLKSKVAQFLGFPVGFWSDPMHYILERLFDKMRTNLLWYRERIKELVIGIIIEFL